MHTKQIYHGAEVMTDAIDADIVTIFVQSYAGIAIQILTLVALSWAGVKFLSKKFDEKIELKIKTYTDPFITDVCKQLTDVSTTLSNFKAHTDTAIDYINVAIANIHNINHNGKK